MDMPRAGCIGGVCGFLGRIHGYGETKGEADHDKIEQIKAVKNNNTILVVFVKSCIFGGGFMYDSS